MSGEKVSPKQRPFSKRLSNAHWWKSISPWMSGSCENRSRTPSYNRCISKPLTEKVVGNKQKMNFRNIFLLYSLKIIRVTQTTICFSQHTFSWPFVFFTAFFGNIVILSKHSFVLNIKTIYFSSFSFIFIFSLISGAHNNEKVRKHVLK